MERAQLEPVVARHLGPGARVTGLARGPLGNGQETWFATVHVEGESVEVVVRRTAAGGTMAWTDRRQEFETLRRVAASGLPVPEVLWFEEAGGELDRSHFAMRRMPGGPASGADPSAVAHDLGRRLRELHSLPPADDAPSAFEATRAELERWRQRNAECGEFAPRATHQLLDWLTDSLPPLEGRARLLWGDPGPHNVLVDERGGITAMLDWEMTHAGHPLDDLAVAMWSCLGMLPAGEVLSGYGPVDEAALRWFRVLAAVSRSIAIVQGVRDFVAGAVDSPVVAGLGWELMTASLISAARGAGIEVALPPSIPEAEPFGVRPTVAEAVEGVASLLAGIRVDAPRDRRMLKAAIALLRAAAARERRSASISELQLDPLAELVAERHAFGALRDLFGPTATPPPIG